MLVFMALDQKKNHHAVPNTQIPFAQRASHRISKEDRRHIRLSPIYGELQPSQLGQEDRRSESRVDAGSS